jgi:hypothetical protein
VTTAAFGLIRLFISDWQIGQSVRLKVYVLVGCVSFLFIFHL